MAKQLVFDEAARMNVLGGAMTLSGARREGDWRAMLKRAFVAGDLHMEQAASDCFHLRSSGAGRDWLLHFRNGSFELAELPAPPLAETAK